MKKTIGLGVVALLSAPTMAQDLSKWEREALCSHIDGPKIYRDTGRDDILGSGATFNVVKNPDVSYLLLGDKIQVSAKKQYYCEFPSFNAEECVVGQGTYGYWESDSLYADPKLVRNFEKDKWSNRDARDFHYKPSSVGQTYITGIVLDKDFKTLIRKGIEAEEITNVPKGGNLAFPYFQNISWLNRFLSKQLTNWVGSQAGDGSIPDQHAYIPMCDSIKVYTHGKPTFTLVERDSHFNGNTLTFDAILDLNWARYSKASHENRTKTIRWYVKNECTAFKWGQCAYPEEDFQYKGTTTSGQNFHQSFPNNDPRTIKAIASDGVSSVTRLFTIGDIDVMDL